MEVGNNRHEGEGRMGVESERDNRDGEMGDKDMMRESERHRQAETDRKIQPPTKETDKCRQRMKKGR